MNEDVSRQSAAGVDVAFPAGDWLFKLHGEVLGPIPAPEIYQHMLAGEIDESTRICREEGEWCGIDTLPAWQPFLLQAKAQIRVHQAQLEALAAARRRRMRNLINVGIGAVALVLISFAASYLLIVQRPWRNEEAIEAWTGKHVPLLHLPGVVVASQVLLPDPKDEPDSNGADVDLSGISVDEILVADAPELVALRPDGSPVKKRKKRRTEAKKPGDKPGDKPGEKPGDKPDSGTAVASVGSLSRGEITARVYAAATMNQLKGCLAAEIKRNEDLPGRVVLNFSIRNDGRVHNVQLDDPRLEDGPLERCFARKLKRLAFNTYNGQVQNVTIPFDWKR